MAPFGLRISQFALLSRLEQAGPLSVRTLAAALVLDRTTMARNLRALERDGLLASEDDPADGRVRRLRITDAGAALLERARPAWQAAQASFEAQFGAGAAGTLQGELNRLVKTVQAPETGQA